MQNQNNPNQKQRQYTKMFLQEIKRFKSLSASDIMVYMVLKCFENVKTRESYPSVKTIIEHTGISRGSVLRAFKKLKERRLIKEEGVTQHGIKRWSFAGITSDTTEVSELIQGGITSDTMEVSELIHKSNKLTENENYNCKVSTGELTVLADEKLFLQLWEKWSDHQICKWTSLDPLKEWKEIKKEVQHEIKGKNLTTELICIDIFLMQQLIAKSDPSGEYSGGAVLWSGARWLAGMTRWLSSDTPSYINAKKRRFLKHAISLQEECVDMSIAKPSITPEAQEGKEEESSTVMTFQKRLKAIYEDFQKHNDMFQMKLDFQDLHHAMLQECTQHEINTMKDSTLFYEMFYSLGEV